MKRLVLILSCLVLATAAMADHHDEEPTMLRQLDYLGGSWSCKGTQFASPMGPEHATRGDVTAKWALDGHWLPFTYAEKKTGENPQPFAVSGFFGYDPEIKMLVLGGVDSGGGYSTAQSGGWDGDILTFTGPWHMAGMTVTGRDTFTKKGADEMVHAAYIEKDGGWMKLAEETCMRK
ncbi:MAG: DUF1579 family protein [Thermoanaerobaculia bacterium]